MRKVTLILSLCVFAFSGFAQRAATKADTKFTFELPKAVKGEADITDTLVPASFYTGTPTIYTASGGGYVCGANEYGDIGKAQHFNSGSETYLVHGVMIWVAAWEETQYSLKFNVYDFVGKPTTELSSLEIPSQITTTTDDFWFSVIFGSPVEVTGDFAVGVEFTGITSGFGLVSTTKGDGGQDAWELWGDGSGWYSFMDTSSWGLDIDMGIFPLISKKPVVINLIKEGDFPVDGPISAPWATWTDNGGVVEVIDGVCTMTPATVSDQRQLQVNQGGITALNDSSYELTFTAWADADRVFGIDFEDPNNSYNRYGDTYDWDAVNGQSEWQIAVNTTPTVYHRQVTFKRILANTNQMLNIMTSSAIEKVYIDDISLVKIPPIPVQDYNVTFKVDMSNATLAETDVVYVTGSFNGWDEPGNGESIVMTKISRNIWGGRTLIPANSGEVTYKYFINTGWGYGDTYGFNNGDRLMQVGTEAFTVNDIWAEPTVSVTFNLNVGSLLADGDVIYVTGTFAGGWNAPGTGKSVLMKEGTDSSWTVTTPIKKNVGDIKYQYKKNAGWANGDIYDRTLTVADVNLTVNDTWIWGNEDYALSSVSIAPNPFSDYLNLTDVESLSTIIVSNLLGQTVMTFNEITNRVVLSTEGLKRGVYFVTIIDKNNNHRTERVIKQ